ncbi:hypothetical protein M5689_000988 [Euphorbia peplus]|nr:hypothetical protein M5689_000988 [Euphorbia peplus]
MAQGLIPFGGEDDPEEIGLKYFEELLGRCFFQPFKIGYDDGIAYTMHDVIHEFVESNSCFPKNRYIFELLYNNDYAASDELFFQRNDSQLKYLRVLDLSSSQIVSLPSSIGECKLLRYLDLSMSSVFGLSDSICELYNLQTLKLLGCIWLEDLPRDLYKLSKLRHLEMDNTNWQCFYVWPMKLGCLTSLRTLSVYPVGHGKGNGYGIDELKDLKHLTGSLHISCLENAVNAKEANLEGKQKLQRLGFEWSERIKNAEYEEESGVKVLEDLLPNENILEIEIVNYRGSDFPIWMRNGMLQNLVVLTLKNCIRCKIVSLDLPSLTKLCIKGCNQLEELLNLQCPVLNELHIFDCRLIHLFPKNGLPTSLMLLRIKKCGRLYEQCEKESGPEWEKIAHIPELQIGLTEDKKRWTCC